jgi:hypothetical protein
VPLACGQPADASEAAGQRNMNCTGVWLLTSEARFMETCQDLAKLRGEVAQLQARLRQEEVKKTAAEAAAAERDAQIAVLELDITRNQSEVSSRGLAHWQLCGAGRCGGHREGRFDTQGVVGSLQNIYGCTVTYHTNGAACKAFAHPHQSHSQMGPAPHGSLCRLMARQSHSPAPERGML